MDKSAFDEYVKSRYTGQMEYYSKASGKNQKNYKRYQWILIILSAITPVLAALSGRSWSTNNVSHPLVDQSIQIALVIISSIVAILTSALKTFHYQELWVTYRATYEQLKPEIHYYNFNVGPYGETGIDKEAMFVTRIETILNKEHLQWPPAREQKEAAKKREENGGDDKPSTEGATTVEPQGGTAGTNAGAELSPTDKPSTETANTEGSSITVINPANPAPVSSVENEEQEEGAIMDKPDEEGTIIEKPDENK